MLMELETELLYFSLQSYILRDCFRQKYGFLFKYLYFCEKLKIMRIDIITVLPEMIEGFSIVLL